MATIERRRFPRIPVQLTGRIASPEGQELTAAVEDISVAGLQLRCDSATALKLTPRGHLTSKGDRVDFDLCLDLNDGESSRFLARCRVVFCRRVAQHDYRMGLELMSLDTDRLKRLERFIVEQLQWD